MQDGGTEEYRRALVEDKAHMSYELWSAKYPNYARWLRENGFYYIPELDKGRGKMWK